jgi:hypothetical protein
MADLTQFDLGSAARVARVVRQVEGQGPKAKPLTFETVGPPRLPGRVAKPVASVMPGSTAVFGIYTGTIGMEVFSGTYVTAYSRHASLTPQDYVTLSKGEVSEGGYQVRQSFGLTSEWKFQEYRYVSFVGGGTATAFNNYADLSADENACLSFAYAPSFGQSEWLLVSTSRPPIALATFTGSWANSEFKQVTLHPTTSTVLVNNLFDDIESAQPANTAVAQFCLLANDGKTWQLAEKKTGPVVFRAATFSGSWSINQTKTVTFRNQTATPNTVIATNLTFNLPDIGLTPPFDCCVSKEGTAWFLVSATEHNTKRGTFVGPWGKGGSKQVSLVGGGSVQAINRHANIDATGTRQCTVARDGMNWELIAAEC